jgi:hypothetical protein
MSNHRAESISVGQLSGKLKDAVQSVLKKNPGFKIQEADIRFLPHPGIIGFVVRDAVVADQKFSDLSRLAGDVAAQLPELAGKSQAAFLRHDGGIIMGFFPSSELEFRE